MFQQVPFVKSSKAPRLHIPRRVFLAARFHELGETPFAGGHAFFVH